MGVMGVMGVISVISIIKGCPIIPIIILTKKGADRCGQHPNYFSGISLLKSKLYNKSYFKNPFPPRGSAKSTSTLCTRSAASVEAGRSPRKRSILGVCEHFEDKPDAEIALLGDFALLYGNVLVYVL